MQRCCGHSRAAVHIERVKPPAPETQGIDTVIGHFRLITNMEGLQGPQDSTAQGNTAKYQRGQENKGRKGVRKERRDEGTKERRNEGTKERRNEGTKDEGTKERRNEGTKERRNEGTKERRKCVVVKSLLQCHAAQGCLLSLPYLNGVFGQREFTQHVLRNAISNFIFPRQRPRGSSAGG